MSEREKATDNEQSEKAADNELSEKVADNEKAVDNEITEMLGGEENPKKRTLRFSTRDIAVTAVLLTFILIFMLVPMQILPIDMAFIPLLAIFIGCQVEGGKIGVALAFSFGLASLLATVVRPTLMSPIFYNPMVSIVPRIMIGITCYFSYVGLRKLCVFIGKKRKKLLDKRLSILICSSISSVIGTLTNTGLVLAMLAAFNWGKSIGGYAIDGVFIASLISINFVIEICVAAAVTPWITLACRRAMRLSEPEDGISFDNTIPKLRGRNRLRNRTDIKVAVSEEAELLKPENSTDRKD